MENTKEILFYETCRLCLKMPGFVNMFQTEDLIHDIFLYTGVKVHNADHLPPKICMKCLEIITEAKRLRKIATENDKNMTLFFQDESKYLLHQGYSQHNVSELLMSSQDSILKILLDTSKEEKEKAIEEDIVSSVSKKAAKRESNDKNDSDAIITAPPDYKMIFVRKDLFDSSETVTSSTKECLKKENEEYSCKRKQMDDEEITEYKCEICNKSSFSTWKKLYLHQRSHNKNIICTKEGCEKKFASKGDLEKHVRTHTGERPYECFLCGKTFVQRVTLKMHREKIHAHEI